ncbi:MAG: hypothetical protein AAFO07_19815, partial [Bacteroidota bacterium]
MSRIEYYHGHLPHFHHIGHTFFVTSILNDAIPKALFDQLLFERESKLAQLQIDAPPNQKQLKLELHNQYEAAFERLLHRDTQQEHLFRNTIAAQIVVDRILEYQGLYYDCFAYTIMSNHIHLLLDFSIQLPKGYNATKVLDNYVNLDKVMQLIKG